MEETALPIVPFGKYKDKSVLELLADEKYVEWLKQQSWFSNQKQIYNIVVHQTIPTTNNSKTPEHNRLQNLFLDKSNQQKLLSKLVNNDLINGINNLYKDVDFIRCFGENIIPEFINKLDNTTIKFEDKFNWDLVIYYNDRQKIEIISNLETELIDKIKYKEQYDREENEKYDNNLLLIDRLIQVDIELDEVKIKLDEETHYKYIERLHEYENDLKIYLQKKTQNEKDIANYEDKLKIYKTKLDKFITHQKKLICQELGINYDNFENWVLTDYCRWSHLDKDTKYTREEKKQLQEIVHDKLKPFIIEFERINTIPNLVRRLDIPIKPRLSITPDLEKSDNNIFYVKKKSDYNNVLNECKKIKYFSAFINVVSLSKIVPLKCKKDYENKYKKDYEDNFNTHYEKYRLQYYRDIIKKYCNKNVYVEKINENQYKISIFICDYNYAVCCELKPSLSDDYPCVLRKLKTQIELTKNDKTNFEELIKKYILIIGSFTSIHVSKEQLITIFKQSNITIVFTDNIFESSKLPAIEYINTNTQQLLSENKLIEENKSLTYNLLQTQEKLLQAEDKIKKLEEEVLSLKSQKQSKTIKDYFVKK